MFYNCASLTSIKLPNSATVIGYEAFKNCMGLASVIIGNNVDVIQTFAFSSTGITSITIPKSVTRINEYAFTLCEGLKEYIVASDNENYSSFNGVLFDKEKTDLIFYPQAKTATSYTVPDGVQSIHCNAFYKCPNLTSVTISNSVTSIEYRAFELCEGLITVTLGNSVAQIGSWAFGSCSALREICSTNPTPPETIYAPGPGVDHNGQPISKSPFARTPIEDCSLFVLSGSAEAYKTVYPWRDFGTIGEMIIN